MSRTLVPLLETPKHRPWTNERWLRRQVAERRIGFYKVAGRVLIDLDELDKFAEHGRVDPVAPITLRSIHSSRTRAS